MRKGKVGIRGTEEVKKNLTRIMGKRRIASMKGLILAAAFIRRDMELVPPLIPVDTGALRASWFATPGFALGKPFIVMGFSAPHAIFAHEIDWTEGKRPGSGPKFLQSALNRNRRKITKIIATEIML
jgi:hypothetical protein